MEIEEKMKVTIEEEPEMEEKTEYVYELNTQTSGEASLITDLLEGCLKAMIIESDKAIDIKISFAQFPEIVLYEVRSFVGAKYLPLRTESIANDGNKFNFAPEEYYLYDNLRIEIKGGFNINVKCVIRMH